MASSFRLPFTKPFTALLCILIVFLLFVPFRDRLQSIPAIKSPFKSSLGPDNRFEDAFNATLGFQEIFAISIPSRQDQRDAMALAASLTNLDITHVDGVTDNASTQVLPPGADSAYLHPGVLRAWRAHINVLRTIVEQNLASALILEGDVDWDIRIKRQMQDFAKATHLLLQPLKSDSNSFLDPSYPRPRQGQRAESFEISNTLPVMSSTQSPYGDIDRWDVLWIGHCGGGFPPHDLSKTPIGRAVIANDETVPEPQHIEIQFGDGQLTAQYPDHTRVVSHAYDPVCSLAYAVSQDGARKLLYELAVDHLSGPFDIMMRSLCNGRHERMPLTCLSVQPQLFQHHRRRGPRSSYSDIDDHIGEDDNEVAFSKNIRWSTRLNFEKLLHGQTDYIDLFKDGAPPRDLGF